ncbi:MAG: NAD-dependent epimerase/dehydratase family protein [Anaerohalosphaeraceae bacterium]|nr:NAD-dependent epimerase/dehydratase family protein [Anaerohalosphaeraceae bacterium]
MKVLITGSTGFVGQYLVKALLDKGISCRLLVRDIAFAEKIFGNTENIELWPGDITKPETLKSIAEGVDFVYHLAAAGHVSAISQAAFDEFVRVNVGGTKNLIDTCKGYAVKKFVHFSSTAAMGLIKKGIVDENTTPQPKSPYQKSKLQSEAVALDAGGDDVSVVVLRPCMIYGPRGKGEFYKICNLMRKGRFPKVGFGRNLTPLVHVTDVVAAAIKAAENGQPGEVYLIASETSIDLNYMRKLVMQAWGSEAMYPYVPVWLMLLAAWCFEMLARVTNTAPMCTRKNIASTVWDRVFSIEKAKTQLGYKPQVAFEQGIAETVDWFRSLEC